MSMFIDVIVVLIIAMFAISGFRLGIIKSLLGVVGTIIASVASSFISAMVSFSIYNQFISDKIISSVTDVLTTIPQNAPLTQQADTIISSLPNYAINIMHLNGIDANNLFTEIDTSIMTVPQAVESVIRPMAVKFITSIATVIIFLVLIILLNFIITMVTKTIDIVGLSTPNKIAGAVFGIVKGVLLIMILSFILYFIMMSLPSDASSEINNAIENSHLYYGIYNISIPEKIISMLSVK